MRKRIPLVRPVTGLVLVLAIQLLACSTGKYTGPHRAHDGLRHSLDLLASSASSTQPLKVLVVHGISCKPPGYSESMQENIAHYLGYRAADSASGLQAKQIQLVRKIDGSFEPELRVAELDQQLGYDCSGVPGETDGPVIRIRHFVPEPPATGPPLSFYEVAWSVIAELRKCATGLKECRFDQATNEATDSPGSRARINRWLKKKVVEEQFSDALVYFGADSVRVREAVRETLCRMWRPSPIGKVVGDKDARCNLAQVRKDHPAADGRYSIIGMSLGSRIVFDTLVGLGLEENAEPFSEVRWNQDLDELSSAIVQRVDTVHLLANQLMLLELLEATPPQAPRAEISVVSAPCMSGWLLQAMSGEVSPENQLENKPESIEEKAYPLPECPSFELSTANLVKALDIDQRYLTKRQRIDVHHGLLEKRITELGREEENNCIRLKDELDARRATQEKEREDQQSLVAVCQNNEALESQIFSAQGRLARMDLESLKRAEVEAKETFEEENGKLQAALGTRAALVGEMNRKMKRGFDIGSQTLARISEVLAAWGELRKRRHESQRIDLDDDLDSGAKLAVCRTIAAVEAIRASQVRWSTTRQKVDRQPAKEWAGVESSLASFDALLGTDDSPGFEGQIDAFGRIEPGSGRIYLNVQSRLQKRREELLSALGLPRDQQHVLVHSAFIAKEDIDALDELASFLGLPGVSVAETDCEISMKVVTATAERPFGEGRVHELEENLSSLPALENTAAIASAAHQRAREARKNLEQAREHLRQSIADLERQLEVGRGHLEALETSLAATRGRLREIAKRIPQVHEEIDTILSALAYLEEQKKNPRPTGIMAFDRWAVASPASVFAQQQVALEDAMLQVTDERVRTVLEGAITQRGKAADSSRIQIVAYNDPNDPLTFDVERLGLSPSTFVLLDEPVDVTQEFLGLFAMPTSAHEGHRKSPEVTHMIACGTEVSSGKLRSCPLMTGAVP